MTNLNPQSDQMADESMIRTLAAQVRCIWPQEKKLFKRYGSPQTILDVGCGTGEFTERLAEYFPDAKIFGIEIDSSHVEKAKDKCKVYGERVVICHGDAYQLDISNDSVDLVVCRHLLQAIPNPESVINECKRVLTIGGWLHLLLEDYTMIHFEGPPEFDQFWLDGPVKFGLDTQCDLRIGRRGLSLIQGFHEKMMNFVVVDTERVDREDFAQVFTAWRDGYCDILSGYLGCSPSVAAKRMDEMIKVIRNGYALWQVPIVSGKLTTTN